MEGITTCYPPALLVVDNRLPLELRCHRNATVNILICVPLLTCVKIVGVSDLHHFTDPETLDEGGFQSLLRKGCATLLQVHTVNLPPTQSFLKCLDSVVTH